MSAYQKGKKRWSGSTEAVNRPRGVISSFGRPFRCYRLVRYLVVVGSLLWLKPVIAQSGQADPDLEQRQSELLSLSLEELADVVVTSVSKQEESLQEAAAAVHVITNEDIRRSGATSIPEALRLAPGLHVARVGSGTWAIGSRGFNDTFANKLLVLIDGRSVYTPLFSGVFWDAQDTLMADIDRIEVIRGPGATLWGANAVNGVINIITKKARETQGVLISGGGGTEERGFGAIRYGLALSETVHMRVYGKYFDRDATVMSNGADSQDDWDAWRGGFRLDWEPSELTMMNLQGEIYDGTEQTTFSRNQVTPPYSSLDNSDSGFSGGHILGRWNQDFENESNLTVQTYYDRTERNWSVFGEKRDTFDAELSHKLSLGERDELIWGMGYRFSTAEYQNTFDVALFDQDIHLYNAFIQDRHSIIEDILSITLGSKFEHNVFTGWEVQPSLRVVWTPTEKHTVWAGISRAVRTPSLAEGNSEVVLASVPPNVPVPGFPPNPLPTIAALGRSPFLEAEDLLAYEIGYRWQATQRLSFDLATFYNDYSDLRSVAPGTPELRTLGGMPYVFAPLSWGNDEEAESYGAELSFDWQVVDGWRLAGSYSRLHTIGADERGRNPENQFMVRSLWNVTPDVTFDANLRYVDELPALQVKDYLALDLRIGWTPRPGLEISVVGQNLLDSQHGEYSPTFLGTPRVEIQRGVYGMISWTF